MTTSNSPETSTPTSPSQRQGGWAEVHTLTEENTGLSVVITERSRGRTTYSYQIMHRGNRFLSFPVHGLEKVPVQGEGSASTADVIRALVQAAEDWIRAHQPARPERPEREQHVRRNGEKDKSKKDKPSKGGLSSLARADAEAKGFDYTSPSARKKEKRRKAKEA